MTEQDSSGQLRGERGGIWARQLRASKGRGGSFGPEQGSSGQLRGPDLELSQAAQEGGLICG